MNQDTLKSLLLLTQLELLVVLFWLLWRLIRTVRKLGPDVHRSRVRFSAYQALVVASWVTALLALVPMLASDGHEIHTLTIRSLLVVSASGFVWMVSMQGVTQALGRDGVQSGWTVARFDEFAEWRLAGAHLRFRLEGKLWEAIEVGADHQEALRTRLELAAPGRESRYTE